MDHWAKFYADLFNFREIRYFDIKGEYTGLVSRALTAPDGLIRIPLNEEKSEAVGQIEEYLREYKGEGIQHIASCDDLVACWDRLKASGVAFMSPRRPLFDMLEERCLATVVRTPAARHPARRHHRGRAISATNLLRESHRAHL